MNVITINNPSANGISCLFFGEKIKNIDERIKIKLLIFSGRYNAIAQPECSIKEIIQIAIIIMIVESCPIYFAKLL